MNNSASPSSSQQLHPHTTAVSFTRFPTLPIEVRLMIWRLAIPIDFDRSPIHLKPYTHNSHGYRSPPKTSRINHESRQETLKAFQRLELQTTDMSRLILSVESRNGPLVNNPPVVWWDKEIDILTLDWWAVVADVSDPVNYLGLKPFIGEQTGIVEGVKTVQINASGSHTSFSKLRELLMRNLKCFIGASEVHIRFVNYKASGTVFKKIMLVMRVEACFRVLVVVKKSSRSPEIYVILEEADRNGRTMGRIKVDVGGKLWKIMPS